VFDAVAFSLSKSFMLAGLRAGIVFGDNLSQTLTMPISASYGYNYFNCQAVEGAKVILSNFKPTYITEHAKKYQHKYCLENDLVPADIWMWGFNKNNHKICITDFIKDDIQKELDLQTI
jgi:aspartate/methionine/tyrosine aminotransferase